MYNLFPHRDLILRFEYPAADLPHQEINSDVYSSGYCGDWREPNESLVKSIGCSCKNEKTGQIEAVRRQYDF